MATFTKRNGKWRALVRIKGRQASKTFEVKLSAIRWAEEKEHEFKSGKSILSGKTVKDAFEKYSDIISPTRKGCRWEQVRLTKLSKLPFASYQLADLETLDLQDWVNDSQLKPNTIRREFSLVRSVLRVARTKWRWLSDSPELDVDLPKKDSPRDRLIPDHEIKSVIDALGFKKNASIRGGAWEIGIAFLLAIETAMRQGEMWKLDWKDIYLEDRYLTLRDTKNGSDRDVPLSKKAVELFKVIGEKNTGNVFYTQQDSAGVIFRRKLKQAKIQDLTFHDTRHEAITRLARKIDVLQLARMVGHHDLNSLMIYYNEKASEIAALLD